MASKDLGELLLGVVHNQKLSFVTIDFQLSCEAGVLGRHRLEIFSLRHEGSTHQPHQEV